MYTKPINASCCSQPPCEEDARKARDTRQKATGDIDQEGPNAVVPSIDDRPQLRLLKDDTVSEEDEWPKMRHLCEPSDSPPPFPLSALPPWLRNMVSCTSWETQTPPILAGSLALGILSLSCAGLVEAAPSEGWKEPLNLYLVVGLESGTRKSGVFRIMTAPLLHWEDRRRASTLSSTGEDESNSSIPSRLFTSDATPEGLARVLYEQNGRIGILSSEGNEVFDQMAGKYAKGNKSNLEIYLKGYSGDAIRIDRANRDRDPIMIDSPALTIALCTQPSVLAGVMRRREYRERGLMARFLVAAPVSPVGSREVNPETAPKTVVDLYRDNILCLLQRVRSQPGERTTAQLKLSDKALKDLFYHSEAIEQDLIPGGPFDSIRDWACKMVGTTVRIAGLLHLASEPDNPQVLSKPIGFGTLDHAFDIVECYRTHLVYALESFGADPAMNDAVRVKHRIESDGLTRFTQRDLCRCLGLSKSALEAALGALADNGYVRKSPRYGQKVRRNASPEWEVNPAVFHSVKSDKLSGGYHG